MRYSPLAFVPVPTANHRCFFFTARAAARGLRRAHRDVPPRVGQAPLRLRLSPAPDGAHGPRLHRLPPPDLLGARRGLAGGDQDRLARILQVHRILHANRFQLRQEQRLKLAKTTFPPLLVSRYVIN